MTVRFRVPHKGTPIKHHNRVDVIDTIEGQIELDTSEEVTQFIYDNPTIRVHEIDVDYDYEILEEE